MATRIKANVINRETFLQVLIVDFKNVYSTTPTIRRAAKAPGGYDCGARLYGMEKSGFLEKKANGGSNLYRATTKGKQHLLKSSHMVQQFGVYEIVRVDDIAQPQAILGSSYSTVADQAMTELAGIIEKNSRLKNTIAGIVQQIDLAIGEI
jgi:hypothetical protein